MYQCIESLPRKEKRSVESFALKEGCYLGPFRPITGRDGLNWINKLTLFLGIFWGIILGIIMLY